MNRGLRGAHLVVWLVLDVILIAVIAAGVLARPIGPAGPGSGAAIAVERR